MTDTPTPTAEERAGLRREFEAPLIHAGRAGFESFRYILDLEEEVIELRAHADEAAKTAREPLDNAIAFALGRMGTAGIPEQPESRAELLREVIHEYCTEKENQLATATRKAREECCKAVCAGCMEGWEIDDTRTHRTPSGGYYHCDAAAIRALGGGEEE